MDGLSLTNVKKSFGATQAVAGVSFDIQPGKVTAVLGPSGCGKSTLLSLIAGLERPDAGEIYWDGQSLAGIPTHQRNFSLMFQDYALFPHMDVWHNVAFGLRMVNLPPKEIRLRVSEVLELVGLPGFAARDVNTLSGGEQQRVALARALAPRPRFLMLDEPLGSLDRALRERLVLELSHILQMLKQTALYVTHDQEEAFTLADRVVVMDRGQVEQIGAPQQIYAHPASLFVARFLGFQNLLPAELQSGRLLCELGSFPYPGTASGRVTVLLRPETVSPGEAGPFQVEGVIRQVTFRGVACRVVLTVSPSLELAFDFPSSTGLPGVGETLVVSFDSVKALQVFL